MNNTHNRSQSGSLRFKCKPAAYAIFVILITLIATLPAHANGSHDNADNSYAFETLAGKTMALTIDKSSSQAMPATTLPTNALIIQAYSEDGTLTFKGYGENTIDSTGTYIYTKIAPNMSLEETVQTSDKLPQAFPYKMVFLFDAPNAGRWYQNFGNGLIYFSGTFNSFTTQ